MTNILEAIINIVQHNNFKIRNTSSSRNRANSMGEALENYLKDAFANTLNEHNASKRMSIFNQKFSWLGNQNNPPDFIIKNGDAIEVKKTQSANSSIALNSSFPKAYLYADSPMITEECRNCEDWQTKDLLYCVGHTTDTHIKSLWFIYGSIYAAKSGTYQRIKTTITTGINNLKDVELAETNELGRVNRVDPLGITNLRIRGMWQIKNPRKVFDYLHQKSNNTFELVAIIPTSKYNSFPQKTRKKFKKIQLESFSISDCQVNNPNNPAKLVDCKLIKYSIPPAD